MGISREGLKVHKFVLAAFEKGFGLEYFEPLTGEWIEAIEPSFDPRKKYRVIAPDFVRISDPMGWAVNHKGKVAKVVHDGRYATIYGESFKVDARHIIGEVNFPTLLSIKNCVPASEEEFNAEFPIVEISMEEVANLIDVPADKLRVTA